MGGSNPTCTSFSIEGRGEQRSDLVGGNPGPSEVSSCRGVCDRTHGTRTPSRRDRIKGLSQEIRAERDAVNRHEPESRLLSIKVRNLEGVASTVNAVVREYHLLEERETRAVSLLERSRHELLTAQREHAMAGRDLPASPFPDESSSQSRKMNGDDQKQP